MATKAQREALGAMAANRFGMGASAGEIRAASSDPRGWLTAQLDGADASIIRDRSLPTSKQALSEVIASMQAAKRSPSSFSRRASGATGQSNGS